MEKWIRELFRKDQQPETSGGGARQAQFSGFRSDRIFCVLLAAVAGVMAARLWSQGKLNRR